VSNTPRPTRAHFPGTTAAHPVLQSPSSARRTPTAARSRACRGGTHRHPPPERPPACAAPEAGQHCGLSHHAHEGFSCRPLFAPVGASSDGCAGKSGGLAPVFPCRDVSRSRVLRPGDRPARPAPIPREPPPPETPQGRPHRSGTALADESGGAGKTSLRSPCPRRRAFRHRRPEPSPACRRQLPQW